MHDIKPSRAGNKTQIYKRNIRLGNRAFTAGVCATLPGTTDSNNIYTINQERTFRAWKK